MRTLLLLALALALSGCAEKQIIMKDCEHEPDPRYLCDPRQPTFWDCKKVKSPFFRCREP